MAQPDPVLVNLTSPIEVIRPPVDVQALAKGQDGRLWAGGKDGVSVINMTTRRVDLTPSCMEDATYVTDIVVDSFGSMWISTHSGVYRYQNGTCIHYTTAQGLPHDTTFCLLVDRFGRVHAGTMNGSVIFEHGAIAGYVAGMQNPIVFTMREGRTGDLWFGSYASQGGGVSILTNGNWQFVTPSEGLPHKAVTSLLSTRDGSFWIGTGVHDRGGAIRMVHDGATWRIADRFTKGSGLAGEKVRSLFEDRIGAIWIGSEYDGVARYANGSFQVLTIQDGLSDNEVIDFVQDESGDLWLGTKNGISRIPVEMVERSIW